MPDRSACPSPCHQQVRARQSGIAGDTGRAPARLRRGVGASARQPPPCPSCRRVQLSPLLRGTRAVESSSAESAVNELIPTARARKGIDHRTLPCVRSWRRRRRRARLISPTLTARRSHRYLSRPDAVDPTHLGRSGQGPVSASCALTAGASSMMSGASISSCSVTATPTLARASIRWPQDRRGGRCCSGSRPSIWLMAS